MSESRKFKMRTIRRSTFFLLLLSTIPVFGQSLFNGPAAMQRAQRDLDRKIQAASVAVRQATAQVPKITDASSQPTDAPINEMPF